MATALLTYDLSDPDDAREHRYALAGRDALLALEAIASQIHATLKHGDPTPEQARLAEEIRRMIDAELLES